MEWILLITRDRCIIMCNLRHEGLRYLIGMAVCMN